MTQIAIATGSDLAAKLAGQLAKVVAIANVPVAGLPVVDGYQTVAGDVILLSAQTVGSQNGPWIVNAGAWARPASFASSSAVAGATVVVTGGGTGAGTVWTLVTTGSVTVDATPQVWVNAPVAGLSAALAGKQPTIPPNTFALPSDLAAKVAPSGNQTILIGDSIAIDGSNTASGNRNAADWFAWAHLISRGRIGYQRNAGTTGDTSTLVLGRLAADVIAYAPQYCIVGVGTNDAAGVGGTVTFATYSTNIKAIVAALRSANIVPILTTILPRNDASGVPIRGTIETWNAWIRRYCLAQRIRLIDWDVVMSDGVGGMISSYTADGIHPIEPGARAMGQRAADLCSEWLPHLTVPLARHQGSASKNLLAGGLFLVDTNADGLADGWTAIGAVTPSRDTGDTAISGNWQRLSSSSTAGFSGAFQAVASGWAVGDTLAICGRAEWDIAANGGGALVQVIMTNGNPNAYIPINTFANSPQAGGVFYGEFVVAPGTTAITVYLYRSTTVSGAGGYFRVAQLTLLNLTALGALT